MADFKVGVLLTVGNLKPDPRIRELLSLMHVNKFEHIKEHNVSLKLDPEQVGRVLMETTGVAMMECIKNRKRGLFFIYVQVPTLIGTPNGLLHQSEDGSYLPIEQWVKELAVENSFIFLIVDSQGAVNLDEY